MKSLVSIITLSVVAGAHAVTLQNATATFSQTTFGVWLASDMIDGNFGANNGWAIFRPGIDTIAETAVFETATDLTAAGLVVNLHQLHGNLGHMVGRFRMSYTTDSRSDFADSLPTGGDVTANWTPMSPALVTVPGGMGATILGDGSIRMSGNSGTGVYSVSYNTAVAGVTGFRLEVLEDPLLPGNGPGLFNNGNFVLNELEIQAVPEPATVASLALGGLLLARRRAKKSA